MPTYGNNFSSIKNKQKRQEVYQKSKKEKKKAKKERQVKRKREEEELGDKAPPRQVGVFFFHVNTLSQNMIHIRYREHSTIHVKRMKLL